MDIDKYKKKTTTVRFYVGCMFDVMLNVLAQWRTWKSLCGSKYSKSMNYENEERTKKKQTKMDGQLDRGKDTTTKPKKKETISISFA